LFAMMLFGYYQYNVSEYQVVFLAFTMVKLKTQLVCFNEGGSLSSAFRCYTRLQI
jgi:hypothetical protein